ncbi:hypothetical protein [Gabonibacter chumensis]|nr:hypothetical protein [Gabonibacter chumensis]MCR9011827.1 hypothetical protein [Gabonibacter chumensis]
MKKKNLPKKLTITISTLPKGRTCRDSITLNRFIFEPTTTKPTIKNN